MIYLFYKNKTKLLKITSTTNYQNYYSKVAQLTFTKLIERV